MLPFDELLFFTVIIVSCEHFQQVYEVGLIDINVIDMYLLHPLLCIHFSLEDVFNKDETCRHLPLFVLMRSP